MHVRLKKLRKAIYNCAGFHDIKGKLDVQIYPIGIAAYISLELSDDINIISKLLTQRKTHQYSIH